MKSDILTYLCQNISKQRTTNLIFAIAIGVCLYKIKGLKEDVKALKEGGA